MSPDVNAIDVVSAIYDDDINVQDYGAVVGADDNSSAIARAVSEAVDTGQDVFLPAGDYVTLSTIDNIHTVNVTGPGRIKRGSDTFLFHERNIGTNTLYVATGGSDANDGFGGDEALLTIQKAADLLEFYAPLTGQWNIDIAAGTYIGQIQMKAYITGPESRVHFFGPDPGGPKAVPTVIIDGTAIGTTTAAFLGGEGNYFKVSDVKLTNWTTSPVNGIEVEAGGSLLTDNVHSDGTERAAIRADRDSSLRVRGGVLENGRIGVETYAGSVTSLGDSASSLATGTTIDTMTPARSS